MRIRVFDIKRDAGTACIDDGNLSENMVDATRSQNTDWLFTIDLVVSNQPSQMQRLPVQFGERNEGVTAFDSHSTVEELEFLLQNLSEARLGPKLEPIDF